jgi:alpha/beta superfamily hydrolase
MEPVRFPTDDGIWLEGELRRPEGPGRGSAVLCHAHPRHGGSKDHPLLWAIRNELVSRGLAVLTFNFRGVLGSPGTYGGGRAERRDLAAAIGTAEQLAAGPALVCGWSFGAMVALLEALSDPSVAALALVGLPVDDHGLDVPALPDPVELRSFRRPVLLVSGQGDQFSPRPGLELVAGRLPAGELRIVPGTDHFFWRREGEVAAEIGSFAERLLG